MSDNSFGAYLKQLRTSRVPLITQEGLADAIGRNKMTVSLFESGKNAPPRGELLNRIIVSLSLTAEEEERLRFLAAQYRRTLPGDIEDYFFENPSICKAIRNAQKSKKADSDWEKLAELFEGSYRVL